jgi:lipooligosaccharide transport system ATP-binding protein
MAPVVELEGVVKRYGEVVAVDGVSLHISRGECYALLGPNGAGKTTISRMIGAVLPRDAGLLRVLGRDPWTEQSEVKARLGVVMQEDALDEELDVLGNLEIHGLFYWLKGPELRARVERLLDLVSLQGKERMPIEALSGGMKRRLIMARALLSEPEMLLLDEPTTGLDPQVRRLVWSTLRRLKDEGLTILLTTHYMEEAAQLADRVGIVDEGRLIAEGSPAQLVADNLPAYVLELDGRGCDAPDELVVEGAVVESRGDGVAVFADDEGALRAWLSEHSLGAARLRPTTLEDVFLKLAGRALDA